MKEAFKKAGFILAKKVTLWLGSLIGLSGGLVIIASFLIFLLILGSIGSTSDEQDSFDFGGNYVCSPTGQVDKQKMNSVLKTAGAFKNKEDAFIRSAEKYGIDPVLFTAIALHETGFGTSSAVKNKNNPGGLMSPSCNWQCLQSFSSLDKGIDAMGKTLHNRIVKDGLVTIEKLGNVYAPIGAENDPNGLNKHWVPKVEEYSADLGGLTMNCELSNEIDFEFDGNVSDLRKKIATVGNKWVGNTKYHWGGGRNPASAARGEFDCSSFVHWAYKENGIELGNMGSVSTETLNKAGKKISINQIKVGDLIFLGFL